MFQICFVTIVPIHLPVGRDKGDAKVQIIIEIVALYRRKMLEKLLLVIDATIEGGYSLIQLFNYDI
jgi:hypothetical protein